MGYILNIDASKYSKNYSTYKNIISKIINIFKKKNWKICRENRDELWKTKQLIFYTNLAPILIWNCKKK